MVIHVVEKQHFQQLLLAFTLNKNVEREDFRKKDSVQEVLYPNRYQAALRHKYDSTISCTCSVCT